MMTIWCDLVCRVNLVVRSSVRLVWVVWSISLAPRSCSRRLFVYYYRWRRRAVHLTMTIKMQVSFVNGIVAFVCVPIYPYINIVPAVWCKLFFWRMGFCILLSHNPALINRCVTTHLLCDFFSLLDVLNFLIFPFGTWVLSLTHVDSKQLTFYNRFIIIIMEHYN